MSILEVREVSKTYKNSSMACHVLDKVSFCVGKGELIALVGPSGSGKTTLFNIISGIDRAFDGTVLLKDMDMKKLSDNEITKLRRTKIGVIFQFFNLISSLTVEENIKLSMELDHKKVREEELIAVMAQMGLLEKRKSFVYELSGGQQQRVAIARTLLCKPDIILADEPTGNLDSENTKTIMNIFRELTKTKQQTILMVTHDKEIAQSADRIFVCEDGRVHAYEGVK